ncbi:unnamed protein product [Prorocentrum cordatum]|uniref:Ion transport domain-containing protein n=1 Tax=Prorocentrum cordatum TaxID=2364126 RepID=A0ABN9PPV3_9DINO|nr:unnamed protein product [Polarella glacialis]
MTMRTQEPARCFQCLQPGIHRDARVLAAMAETRCPEIFDTKGCKTLVKLAWKRVQRYAYLNIFARALEVALLVCLTMALNDGSTRPERWSWLNIGLLMWNMLEEVCQAIGFVQMGLSSLWTHNFVTWVDVFRLAKQAYVYAVVVVDGDLTNEFQRILLAIAVFWSWMRVLYSLRVLKVIGKPMLPILNSMQNMSAFLLVVVFWLGGFSHMYYACGLSQPFSSFMTVFRLAMLGDFELEEMESDAEGTVLAGTWVQLFVIVVGFMMTITILNIFIGVVGMSYEKALDEAERAFQRQRAKASLNHVAHMEGLRTVLCCRRSRPKERKDIYAWYAHSLDEETLTRSSTRQSKELTTWTSGWAGWRWTCLGWEGSWRASWRRSGRWTLCWSDGSPRVDRPCLLCYA